MRRTVTLTNIGATTLTLSSIEITGDNPDDFAQTNTCGTRIAAGTGCTIRVTFTPSATGSRTASLTITDGTGNQQSISLSGTGVTFSLSTNSVFFGNQALGTTSVPQTVILTNAGTATLNLSSIAMTGSNSGDFAQTNTCGTSVAAGAGYTIGVSFTPSATGFRNAQLSITDSSENQETINLFGAGVSFLLSTNFLDFGNQTVGTTSPTQIVTLANSGPTTLNISSIVMTGSNSGDFAQTNTCGTSVAAGAACTIRLTFIPSTTGARTASVTITDVNGSQQAISLSGTGTKQRRGQVTSN